MQLQRGSCKGWGGAELVDAGGFACQHAEKVGDATVCCTTVHVGLQMLLPIMAQWRYPSRLPLVAWDDIPVAPVRGRSISGQLPNRPPRVRL